MSNVIRKLSLFERYYFERNQARLYSNFFIAGVYKNLDAILLSNALQRLISKYPQFSANVFGNEGKTLQLRTVSSIRFEDVVEYISAPELDTSDLKINESISKIILTRTFNFNVDKPLWKLCIVNNEILIFYCDHLILDGTSGANFHMVLLDLLNQCLKESGLTKLDVLFDSKVSLPELKYEVIPEDVYYPGLVKIIKSYSVSQWILKFINSYKNSGEVVAADPIFKSASRVSEPNDFFSHTQYIRVPPQRLQALLQLCRQNGVRLTSLILFLCQLSISHVIEGHAVPLSLPISSKGRLNTKIDQTFGLFGVGAQTVIPALTDYQLQKIDWKGVKRIQELLDKVSNFEEALQNSGMLKYIDLRKIFQDQIGKPSSPSIVISNLLLYKPSTSGPVEIEEMYFNQCLGAGFLNLNVISTPKGGMVIGFSYCLEELLSSLNILDSLLNGVDFYR